MTSHVPVRLRQLITERAEQRCEYCLLPQAASFHRHEPDHIVPVQHGGGSDEDNLALSCPRCNRYKGPNVGSFDPVSGALVAFFNPRTDSWEDHFTWEDAVIRPLTAKARVTARILRFNDEDRVAERQRLMELRLFS